MQLQNSKILASYVHCLYENYMKTYTHNSLASNKLSDINECAQTHSSVNGGCMQQCVNTPGSYQCLCHSGFTLTSEGRCVGKWEEGISSVNRENGRTEGFIEEELDAERGWGDWGGWHIWFDTR